MAMQLKTQSMRHTARDSGGALCAARAKAEQPSDPQFENTTIACFAQSRGHT